uniref:Uncharacterized protein n=1 Tax=Utricularia reniformis TaxID=192314 RepID=A0A1Y0AZC5_9LAMI|nr:hypothetical protein AEK19_MT0216 [Utricularia reniformis]ART30494.1 hypothetical protein AEK19_MT0216 [Utricularia reniformis]
MPKRENIIELGQIHASDAFGYFNSFGKGVSRQDKPLTPQILH